MVAHTLPGIGLTGDIEQGAPWKVAGDANWMKSSVLTQLAVESMTTSLPLAPLDGVIYIVPAADANGNQIAARDAGAWTFFQPARGWVAYVRDASVLVSFDGAAWGGPLAGPNGAAQIGTQPLSGGIPLWVQDSLRLAPGDLLRWVPRAQWAAIFARTSTYDCTPALVAAMAATNGNVTPSLPGRFRLASRYVGTTNFNLTALCSGVELDLTTIATGNCIQNSGSVTLLTSNVIADIVQGRDLIQCDSLPALQVGDVFCVYNSADYSYSGWRPTYRAGEWKEVLSISGNNIVTTEPFYAGYPAGSVAIYKLNSVDCRLTNVRLIGGTGNKQLAVFSLSKDAVFDRVTAEGSNYASLVLDRCYKWRAYSPNIRNLGTASDDYGLSVGNSQAGRSYGGNIYARRHGVAQGGLDAVCAVPSRDNRYYSAIISNDPEQSVGAVDYHGNVEKSVFDSCVINGAVKFGGGDGNYCINCNINASGGEVQANTLGWIAYFAEVKGGRMGVIGGSHSTYRDPQASSQGIISINGIGPSGVTGLTTEAFTPVLRDCKVKGRNLSGSTRLMVMFNRGASVPINPEVDEITLDVNALGSVLNTSNVAFTCTASITGTVLDVTVIATNQLGAGQTISGTGITVGTKILSQLTGTPGGVGTYQVDISQTAASTTVSSIGTPLSTGIVLDNIDNLPAGTPLHNAGGNFYRNFVSRYQRLSGSASVSATTTLTPTSAGTQLVNATGGAVTMNLPAAALMINQVYNFKKVDASANVVTIDPNGSETVDGAATLSLTAQWQRTQIQSDGVAWFVI